jgi:hypothetical protein
MAEKASHHPLIVESLGSTSAFCGELGDFTCDRAIESRIVWTDWSPIDCSLSDRLVN